MTSAEQQPESNYGKTPNEIIHHHLLHPEEPVTGEEIRNAKITEAPADLLPESNADTGKEIKKEEEVKEERQFPITSTYDVLGS